MMKVKVILVKHVYINARVRVRPRVNARAKIQNAPNRLKFILHTFQPILIICQKIAHTRIRARFPCVLLLKVKTTLFCIVWVSDVISNNF